MRVLLILTGQPRAYKEGFSFLSKNLFEPAVERNIGVDLLYVHSDDRLYDKYEILNFYNAMFSAWFYNGHVYCHDIVGTHVKPISYLEQAAKAKLSDYECSRWPVEATINSFRNICQAKNYAVDLNMTSPYAFIVRTRTDFALNINLIDLIQDIQAVTTIPYNSVFVPGDRRTPANDFANDQFALGRPSGMFQYMSTYEHIPYFISCGVKVMGEDLLSANLKLHNLVGDSLHYIDMNHPFHNGPYNTGPHSLIRTDTKAWLEL